MPAKAGAYSLVAMIGCDYVVRSRLAMLSALVSSEPRFLQKRLCFCAERTDACPKRKSQKIRLANIDEQELCVFIPQMFQEWYHLCASMESVVRKLEEAHTRK